MKQDGDEEAATGPGSLGLERARVRLEQLRLEVARSCPRTVGQQRGAL